MADSAVVSIRVEKVGLETSAVPAGRAQTVDVQVGLGAILAGLKFSNLIALAKNERGRIALNEIVTKSNFEGFYSKPRVDLSMLIPYANDLIIMTACLGSELAHLTHLIQAEDYNDCIQYINKYKSIFPHFYLEMQSHETEEQEKYNKELSFLTVIHCIF